jgi:ATP-dependent DNA helicase RecQ
LKSWEVKGKRMDALHEGLRRWFGYEEFRPGQEEIIRTLLGGQDVLAIMTTGAGKSLCYQLPALLLPGVTLVISPLIALMQDQVRNLEQRGIDCATFLNSSLLKHEIQERMEGIRQARYKIVYIAPERIRSREFLAMLSQVRVSLLVVDEAHCISEWGHDFRTDYLLIGSFRERLGQVPVMALTATATREVQEDIAVQLGMEEGARIVMGYDRPNLMFLFRQEATVADKYRVALAFLRRQRGCGMIYLQTRGECELFARMASQELGEKIACYHAGMQAEERRAVQEAFMRGEYRMVAATNAFGMGIDKPDIRFVLHLHVPSSVEAFYQEAGRAGRDGRPSVCLTIFTQRDRGIHHFFVRKEFPSAEEVDHLAWRLIDAHQEGETVRLRWEELAKVQGFSGEKASLLLHLWEQLGVVTIEEMDPQEVALRYEKTAFLEKRKEILFTISRLKERRYTKLNAMVELLSADGCRRQAILRYFGQEGFSRPHPCCDRCDPDWWTGQEPADTKSRYPWREILREILPADPPSIVPRLARTEGEEAYALGEARDVAGLPRLYELLKSPSVTTRRMAVSAIGKIQQAESVPYLLALLKDINPQVRQYTLKALRKIGDRRARPHVEEMLKREDKEYNIREARAILQEWSG